MTTTTAYRYSHTVGSLSNQGRGFQNPVDVALDSNGVMFVLNRAGPELPIRLPYKRVSMCTVEEEYLGEFGSGGAEAGQFWWPSALAFDSRDRLYVADEALNRVTIFSNSGGLLGTWGEPGAAPGQLNAPSGIVFDADRPFVADRQRQPPATELYPRRRAAGMLGRTRLRAGAVRVSLGSRPRPPGQHLRFRLGERPGAKAGRRRKLSGRVPPPRQSSAA